MHTPTTPLMDRVRRFLRWLLERFDACLLTLEPLAQVYFMIETVLWI
jgi:hypothetical protein